MAERLQFGAYNIGSGLGQTMRDYAAAVRAAIPGAEIEVGPGGNALGFAENRSAVFDITRAGRDFGYAPKYDLTAGVADYVARLRAR